ncbi:MAG: 7-cyano-7-deazaguanine synthase QueC [Deltaproteobacteria bacterium]|nr:7-cyano-7-deazaguanine synthase QueC [Deltaproteobacteria bacterium]
MKKAVVLYSGGLDSTTCMAIARDQGFATYALSFAYGQRHTVELAKAREYAPLIGAEEHMVIEVNLRQMGGSALTGDIEVPKDGAGDEAIPVTYVPARNTIFLSFALGWAEVLGASDIFIGVNALDYSGYPDCRPEFIEAFQQLAKLATKAGIEGNPYRIQAPLINLSKAQIIQTGLALGVDYRFTHSCYDPTAEGLSCGHCDSCRLRLKGFAEAGCEDPVAYVGCG